MVAAIMAVTAAAMVAAIMGVTAAAMVAVIMVVTAAAMVAAIMAVTAAAMVVVIMALTALTLINLLELKVGKTEVMEILLITLNMKVVGAGEKGECPMTVILQTRQIRNPFLQALSLI